MVSDAGRSVAVKLCHCSLLCQRFMSVMTDAPYQPRSGKEQRVTQRIFVVMILAGLAGCSHPRPQPADSRSALLRPSRPAVRTTRKTPPGRTTRSMALSASEQVSAAGKLRPWPPVRLAVRSGDHDRHRYGRNGADAGRLVKPRRCAPSVQRAIFTTIYGMTSRSLPPWKTGSRAHCPIVPYSAPLA